jgi:ankyrin repeat protein
VLPARLFLFGCLLATTSVAAAAPLKFQSGQKLANSNSTETAPTPFPDEEVASHETGRHKPIRVRLSDPSGMFASVRLTLIVGPDGNVISARPQEGPPETFPRAITEAKTWTYLPFEKDGIPTVASITDYVEILPPEELPKAHRDFPRIGNMAGLHMTLSRTGCFGTCPSYTIEIRGDGSVIYNGEAFVVLTGQHRDQLSPEKVLEITDAFRNADYFSLDDKYSYPVTDLPTYTTSIKIDGISKSVDDYAGPQAGMPQSISELEETIDRVAGSTRWIAGNSETVPSLKREGWDFKSSEASSVLARASQEGNSDLVRDLLAEGVQPSGTDQNLESALAAAAHSGNRETVKMLINAGAGKDNVAMKTSALASAAQIGDVELVRLLLEYGADPKLALQESERGPITVLMYAALSGVPAVVQTILASRPDVNARDGKGRTALWYLSEGNTYTDEKRHADRAEVVHLLAHAGANLNSQDNEGNAPLHTAYLAKVAGALIQDGANLDIRNAEGETPLMSNFDLDVAKMLVAAGADIHARNHEGKTALDLAREFEPNGERTQFLQSLFSGEAGHRQVGIDLLIL